MSRSYEMMITVTGFDESCLFEIEKACFANWPFEAESFSVDRDTKNTRVLSGNGIGSLCIGESEEEFTDRLAKAVWKANGSYCEVGVQALYLEGLPYERHLREEDDYERLMSKVAETQNDHRERLVS